jgi:hypothetical protein
VLLLCSISKEKVYIKRKYLDLSSYVNQGMGYYDGVLYVPVTGDDSNLNQTVITVYNLDNVIAGSTIYPTEYLHFRVTSGTDSARFETESCDICSGDGGLRQVRVVLPLLWSLPSQFTATTHKSNKIGRGARPSVFGKNDIQY